MFAGFGLAANANFAAAGRVVAGVFLGSAAWWVILVAVAGWLRNRIRPRLIRAANIVSGLAILAFAGWQLAALLR